MSDLLSKYAQSLEPSLLWKFFDLARSTPDVVSLSVGEPDFPTPWHIREEGIYALEKGRTYYPPTLGLTQLREGIAEYYARRFGIDGYTADNVLVTVGASEAIDLALRVTMDAGDECIVLDPGYVAYEPLVKMVGGVPVYLKLEESDGFKVKPQQLEALITPRTKAIILNYPSNPTGGVMSEEDYAAIVPILSKHHIVAICDEIYLELTYEGEKASIARFRDVLKDHLIVVNGFSKAWSMTGWRLGYACGPKPLISVMTKIHQSCIMCAPTTSQNAALTALFDCDDEVQTMHNEYDRRRQYCVRKLNEMGLKTFEPEGAFYVFPDISSSGMRSEEFCEKLLKEQKVAIIPGTAFGSCGEGYARISYAYSLRHLQEAMKRIACFLDDHRKERTN